MQVPTGLPRRDRWARGAAAALVLAGAAIAFFRNRSVGLVGPDTYPLILASRARSLDELASTLVAPLGGGHLAPIYYRPLLHLTLALDHAVGGLDPRVYQLTSALLFAAASAALFFAAAELTRGRAGAAALVALGFFLIHPVQALTLPEPARRPELLAVLFMALAVGAQARAARSARRLPVAPAVGAFCAFLSKETTFVLPALCFTAAWACMPPRPWRRRLLDAGIASLPTLGALIGVLALRLGVLGDVLGPRPFRGESLAGSYLATSARIAAQLTSGSGFLGEASPPLFALSGLGLALGACLAGARAALRREILRESGPLVAVALVWLALCSLVYTLSGLQPWYLELPAAGAALLAGGVAATLLRVLGEARAPLRAAAAVGLVCGAAIGIELGRFSPLFRAYPDWQKATPVGRPLSPAPAQAAGGRAPGRGAARAGAPRLRPAARRRFAPSRRLRPGAPEHPGLGGARAGRPAAALRRRGTGRRPPTARRHPDRDGPPPAASAPRRGRTSGTLTA